MDWDDEYGNMAYPSQREEFPPDNYAESGINPMDITAPASAYLFLSDDAEEVPEENDDGYYLYGGMRRWQESKLIGVGKVCLYTQAVYRLSV